MMVAGGDCGRIVANSEPTPNFGLLPLCPLLSQSPDVRTELRRSRFLWVNRRIFTRRGNPFDELRHL
jgi:hypothetical protein